VADRLERREHGVLDRRGRRPRWIEGHIQVLRDVLDGEAERDVAEFTAAVAQLSGRREAGEEAEAAVGRVGPLDEAPRRLDDLVEPIATGELDPSGVPEGMLGDVEREARCGDVVPARPPDEPRPGDADRSLLVGADLGADRFGDGDDLVERVEERERSPEQQGATLRRADLRARSVFGQAPLQLGAAEAFDADDVGREVERPGQGRSQRVVPPSTWRV